MYWTDDPVADFDKWDRAQERALARLPKCKRCRDPIQSEFCYEVDDEYICDECIEADEIEEATRVYVNDLIM